MPENMSNNVAWMADGYQYRSTGAIYKTPVTKIGSNNVIVHPRVAWGSRGTSQNASPVCKPASEQSDRVHMAMLFRNNFSYITQNEETENDQNTKVQKRPSSAPMERIQKIKAKLGYSTYTVLKRPSSGKKVSFPVRPASATVIRPPSIPKPGSRPASAASCRGSTTGSQKSTGRQASELRKSYTLINRTYEEDRYNLDTYATACPNSSYMDRHARCFDHTHIHRQLLRNRPQKVCDNCGVLCESQNLRPGSAAEGDVSGLEQPSDREEQPFERYTSSLRPKSAPAKRNLFPRYNSITRGTIPHFCNFVKKVRLKEKENEKPQADHTHHRHRGDSDNEGASSNTVHPGSSHGGSHDKLTGRPSSPASVDTESLGHHGNTAWPEATYSDNLSQESLVIDDWQQVPGDPLDEPAVSHIFLPPDSSNFDPVILPTSIDTARKSTEKDQASQDSIDINKSSQALEEALEDAAVNHVSVPTGSSSPELVAPPTSSDVTSGNQKLTPVDDNSQNQLSGNNGTDRADKEKSNGEEDQDSSKPNMQPSPPQKATRTLIEPPPMLTKPADPPRNSPYPHQNVVAKKPRSPIVKKEKKPFERQRQEKQEEEVTEVKVEEPKPEPEVIQEVTSPDLPTKPKLEAVVPELPSFKDKEIQSRRRLGSSRAGKQGIKFMSPFDDPDVDKDTLETLKDQRKAFELTVPETTKEDSQQKPRMQSWLQGRLALSQQSSRFELPMDMKTLEKMSPQDYLKKHCVISTRRHALYHKVHTRYKEKGGLINVKDLDRALQDVLVNTLTSADTKHICQVVGLEEGATVDFKLFAGIAAMAERMLYPKFVTDDTADMKEFKKETIECADFSALDWKLHGLDINPQIHTILKFL